MNFINHHINKVPENVNNLDSFQEWQETDSQNYFINHKLGAVNFTVISPSHDHCNFTNVRYSNIHILQYQPILVMLNYVFISAKPRCTKCCGTRNMFSIYTFLMSYLTFCLQTLQFNLLLNE